MSLAKMKSLAQSGALFGLLDQVVISGMNLVVSLLLIHLVSKAQYGLYGLGFAVIAYILGIGNAVLFTPKTVIFPQKRPHEQSGFLNGLFTANLLIALAVLIIFGAGVALFYWADQLPQDLAYFWWAVGLGGAFALVRDFFRKYFYLMLKPQLAFVMDAILALSLIAALLLLGASEPELMQSLGAALYFVVLALSVVLVSALMPAMRQFRWHFGSMGAAVTECWQHGRWGLVGMSVTFLQAQSYVFILGALVSSEAVGEANAARMVVAPMLVVITGLSQFLIPKLSYLRVAKGEQAVIVQSGRMYSRLLWGVIAYSVLLALFSEQFVQWVLSAEYADAELAVWLWLVLLVVQTYRILLSVTLQVLKRFKALVRCNVWSAVVTLTLGCGLSIPWGVAGAIIALLAGEVVFSIALKRELSRTPA